MLGRGIGEAERQALPGYTQGGRWTKAIFAILLSALLVAGVCKCVEPAFAEEGFFAQIFSSEETPAQTGASNGTVFKGDTGSNPTFTPQGVVKLNLSYKYSNTGGLAGIDVAPSQTVEAIAEKQGDGTYKVTYRLPTKEGFRIVLNPSNLNSYLVNPPVGTETTEQLKEMLENGDFNVDIDRREVYYYQQENSTNHNLQNPEYENRYSNEYNQAWNAARVLTVTGDEGYTARAVCGDDSQHDWSVAEKGHGANALQNPKIEVTLDEKQLANAQSEGLNITVNYRRNATWYLVKHWVPETLCGLESGEIEALPGEDRKTEGIEKYVCLDKDTQQGRVGAQTRATARTHTDNGSADGNPYELVQPNAFAQKLIENQTTNNETTVDIFYSAASSYRVIFDTDYTYIPRQQVELGKEVDFRSVTTPKRTGYTFAGWRYLKKGATANADGTYEDGQYNQLDASNPELTIDETTIDDAKLEETGGVLALHLYPKWTPDDTQVRVIFWTEDLTGTDDVQAVAAGGNTSEYDDKYADYRGAPVTHEPTLGAPDAHYSNVHSFTMRVKTDSSLLDSGGSGSRALLADIQDQVDDEFRDAMGQASDLDVADFYSQAGFEIVHEDEDGPDYNATTASGDGKTTIYVYFTRNVYELLFTYYGRATVRDDSSDYCVAINTNGYSFSHGAAVPDGTLNFDYSTPHDGGNGTYRNGWMRADVQDAAAMPVPQTITIRAKYGADLRDVWPVARSSESVESLDSHGGRGTTARMVSWGTTDGKYCEGGFFDSGKYNAGEPTIMGTYAAMGSEIVADPMQPVTFDESGQVVGSGLRHNLVAYWFNGNISYYRNNHCFEIPDLDVSGMDKVSICNDDTSDPKNFLYLVPIENTAVAKYDFNDLMRVSYEDGQIRYDDPNGAYYAVREYNGKYYAVARQVETVSSNSIEKQNPSARLHMTRANTHADHSKRYADVDGAWDGTTCGAETDPYDLYFYYDRDRYTITYMAPSNNFTTDSEATLGTVRLPYGAQVTKDAYGFKLGYKDKNDTKNGDGSNKYGWELKNTDNTANLPSTPVCPDRADNGTKPWTFKGWALGPAGVNMQWTMNEDAGSEAQAGDTFAIDSNMRLYAIWDAPSYEVTFHLNGGTIGSSGKDVVESVPANRRYTSTEAIIPRPLRAGYTLEGWYVADGNGNITSPETKFDFDQAISEDKHVAAKWSANSTEKFSYTVYYVTKDPLDGDKGKETVLVDENGNITPNGGTTYYVLEKSEQTNQAFNPDSTMAFAAKNQPGYVPVETNKVLVMDQANDTYNVVFCYDPIKSRSHTVRFVEAGTESSDDPTIVDTFKVEADQTVATPSPKNVADLLAKGYALVNKNDSDDGYVAVDEAAELKWVNSKGESQEMDTLDGDGIPDTITYLVQPISYTVSYVNANGSPAAAGEALRAVTAGEGTSVGGAGDKNPTLYTAKDSFDVKNPDRVWDDSDKKWYVFDGWTLKEGTTTGDGSTFDKTTDLSVGAGTVGALTFVANWREASVVTLDGGTNLVVQKNLTGRDWAAGVSFEFVLEPSNDATTQAVTGNKVKLPDNAKSLVIGKDTADHKASFGDISFFEEGAYTFNVRETKGAIGNITYDGHTATFQVNVTEDNGQLKAELDGDADLTFLNTYYDSGKAKDVKAEDAASSVDGEAVGVGTELLYTVDWANNALDENGKPVTANVVVTDVVPDGTELVEGSISEDGSIDPDSKIITWNFENQEPGSVGTVSFKVKVTEDAVANNHVENAANVKIGDNDSIVTNKTDNFVPGKSVILPEGGVKVGDELTYTVKYKNTKDEAAKITVTDRLPAGLTLVEGSLGDSALYEEDSRTITWNIEGVQPGVEGSVTFKVVVNEGALVKDSTKNTASVAVGDDPAVNTNTTPGFDVEIIETTFDTASVGLSKVLTGRDWLDSDSFEFKLTAVDGAPMPKDDGGNVVDTATVTKVDLNDGKAAFGFGTIKYAEEGNYTYQVIETNYGQTINGVTYASNVAKFTVHVADNDNGSLLAAIEGPVENGNFENTYSAKLDYGAMGGLSIFKTLNGRDMAANQFGFTVKPANWESADKLDIDLAGEEFKNLTSANNGDKSLVKKIGEGVKFSQDDAGKTYSYVVSETTGGNADEGYTNDAAEYKVTIATEHDPATAALTVTTTVSDGANEKAYVYTTGTDPDEADAAEVSFVNRYGSSGTLGGDGNVKIDAVKQLTGRPQTAGEFSFVVTDIQDNVVTTGENAADGTISFKPVNYTTESLEKAVNDKLATRIVDADGKITYEFQYGVSEITSQLPTDPDNGVSGSATSFPITVQLVDDGSGTLGITVGYPQGMDKLPFKNTYTSKSAPFSFAGTKVLVGAPIESVADKFTFTITGEDGAPLPANTKVNNGIRGYVTFGEVEFTHDHLADVRPDKHGARTKTFTYHVTESGTASGVANDAQATKTFELTVTDDGKGRVNVVSDHQDAAQFTFINTYSTTPKDSSLTGKGGFTLTKTLDGRDLVAGEFEFDLIDVTSGKVVAKGENDKSGNVKMGAVTFEEPGTHQYRLVEVNPNESDGITYDASSYDVSAVATDVDFDGVLEIVWSVADAEGTDLKFVNSYKAAPSSITFNAIKQLDGRDIKAGEFEFELVQDGKVIQTAKNLAPDKSGVARIGFEPIEYAETGEFDYEIREVKGDAEGVTYDDQVFTYHVTVTDPGNGKLKVEWAQGDNGAPVFKNVYEKQASPLDPVLPPDDGDDDDNGGDNGNGGSGDAGIDAGNGNGDGGSGDTGDGDKLPKTGDTSPTVPLTVVVVLAACVAAVAALRMRGN